MIPRLSLVVATVLLLSTTIHCTLTPPPRPTSSGPRRAAVDVTADTIEGPVPDYDLLEGVVIHRDVDDLAPDLRPALERYLGPRLVLANWVAPNQDPSVEDGSGLDPTLHWLRDYQPVAVRRADGGLRLVHYLADNPNRSAFRPPGPRGGPDGHTWLPGSEGGGQWVPADVVPLLHENGNLLVVGREVLVSELLIERNREVHHEPHLVAHGYRPRSREEVLRLFARALGRSVDDVLVLPPMPFESTGHVDLFLLPLDDRTVMVPSIEDRALRPLRGQEVAIGRVIKVFLDEQASRLRDHGLVVVRWPMMPPAVVFDDEHADDDAVHEEPEEEDDELDDALARYAGPPENAPGWREDYELVVFSPANALLLDVAPKPGWPRSRLAVLPSFESVFNDPAQAATSAAYQLRWMRAAREAGWVPVVVDASDLVGYLGLFHCVSWPLPRGADGLVAP